jgi:uncharacterized protein YecT (DUF1311 family)
MDWKTWIPVILLLLAGVGYLAKRRVEGKREAEVADNAHKWAKLHREMHDSAPTLDDIIRLKAAFMEKQGPHEAAGEQTIQVEADEAPEWMFFGYELSDWERERAKEGTGLWSQLELNEQAAKAAKLVNDNLSTACEQLSRHLSANEQATFNTAIEKWRDYRNAQATYAGSQYEGGSIAPMIYWSEYFGATKAKLASVKEDLRFRAETSEREKAMMEELAKEWDEPKPH